MKLFLSGLATGLGIASLIWIIIQSNRKVILNNYVNNNLRDVISKPLGLTGNVVINNKYNS